MDLGLDVDWGDGGFDFEGVDWSGLGGGELGVVVSPGDGFACPPGVEEFGNDTGSRRTFRYPISAPLPRRPSAPEHYVSKYPRSIVYNYNHSCRRKHSSATRCSFTACRVTVCWPQDLLLEEMVSHVRVLALGYDANVNSRASLNTCFNQFSARIFTSEENVCGESVAIVRKSIPSSHSYSAFLSHTLSAD
jgi:hypothetical protein